MTIIAPTDKPVYYAVEYDGEIVISDKTEIGNTTFTSNTVYQSSDENTFLGLVAGKVDTYNPIPDVGEWCEAGMIYGYNGGLVICRQPHFRTADLPEDVLALWLVYREDAGILEWIPNEKVYKGTLRLYEKITYQCIQEHVTQIDWTPPAAITLWKVYVEPTTIAAWVQPTGSHDAYPLGAQVTHNGRLWESLYAANVWEPGVFGWKDLGAYP